MKSGDAVIEETYAFTDKSGRMLALRPELTAPTMRLYMEKMKMSPKPLKVYYFGNCFRYDRPQKGRYREFWQMGCEIIGANTPESMAELVSTAYRVLKEAGLDDVKLRIGDLDILRSFIKRMEVEDEGGIMRFIDKSDYDGVREMLEGKEGVDKFMEFLECRDFNSLCEFLDEKWVERLGDVLDWLRALGTPYTLDTSIARGLDYYRGIVFEIDAPSLGAEKQLCGGGEYSLLPLLGGDETPTAGFALGFDRIMLALEREGHEFVLPRRRVYIHPIGDEMRKEAAKLASRLRDGGVAVEMDLMRRSVQKSLQYADRIGARKAMIMGPDEWSRGMVTLKDMETGEQMEVKADEVENMPGVKG